MSDYYELAQPFDTNPDPNFAGCLNSQKEERGVVFPGIEPAEASYCFVGESSLYEGVAALHGTTPKKVQEAVKGIGSQRGKIKALEAEIEALTDELKRFESFKSAAEDAGLFIPALD